MRNPVYIFFFLLLSLVACKKENPNYQVEVSKPLFIQMGFDQLSDVIVHDIFSPPVASRIYAYTAIAAYEAGRYADPKYKSLAGQINGLSSLPEPDKNQVYSYPIASIEAMYVVGTKFIFSEDSMKVHHMKYLKNLDAIGVPKEVKDRSIKFGDAIAKHIIEWANKDNYKESRSFPKYTIETDNNSTWKPTPPAYMDAIEPHWDKIRPLVIDSAKQFRPAPPSAFSTAKTSAFYRLAKEVMDVGNGLTDEQKKIADFWDCNPYKMNINGHVMHAVKKFTPGGHWINICRIASEKTNADFAKTLHSYAAVSICLFDSFISCWTEKYRSKVIRPETYINDNIDQAWKPFIQTPPFPEYTSGHSVISRSSSLALASIYGDSLAFADNTEEKFGIPTRNFNSFSQAANEAAMSRLYGGIHYTEAIEEGSKQGFAIGSYILNKIKFKQ